MENRNGTERDAKCEVQEKDWEGLRKRCSEDEIEGVLLGWMIHSQLNSCKVSRSNANKVCSEIISSYLTKV